ncbi:MAG: hypothetical protein LBI29_00290 [Rickettsiales bacterium]|jgi:hypothetical protein|nr:hypothetical protein [Rickettsiales bacterium]
MSNGITRGVRKLALYTALLSSVAFVVPALVEGPVAFAGENIFITTLRAIGNGLSWLFSGLRSPGKSGQSGISSDDHLHQDSDHHSNSPLSSGSSGTGPLSPTTTSSRSSGLDNYYSPAYPGNNHLNRGNDEHNFYNSNDQERTSSYSYNNVNYNASFFQNATLYNHNENGPSSSYSSFSDSSEYMMPSNIPVTLSGGKGYPNRGFTGLFDCCRGKKKKKGEEKGDDSHKEKDFSTKDKGVENSGSSDSESSSSSDSSSVGVESITGLGTKCKNFVKFTIGGTIAFAVLKVAKYFWPDMLDTLSLIDYIDERTERNVNEAKLKDDEIKSEKESIMQRKAETAEKVRKIGENGSRRLKEEEKLIESRNMEEEINKGRIKDYIANGYSRVAKEIEEAQKESRECVDKNRKKLGGKESEAGAKN